MSRICRGKGPFTCPSCDWNENCRFAWCKYDELPEFVINDDGKLEVKKDESDKM